MKSERYWTRCRSLKPAVVWMLLLCCSKSVATGQSSMSSSSMPSPSLTVSSIVPSPTSSLSSVSSTSVLPAPSPSPQPKKPLILYNNGSLLYLRIEEISIKFNDRDFPEVNRTLLEGLGDLPVNVHYSPNEITFTKWYGSAMHNFSMEFDFFFDEPDVWYLKRIIHTNPNVTSDQSVLFEYKNIMDDLQAPTDYTYTCDDITAIGYDSADPSIIPVMKLINITVQAFHNGRVSKGTISCDDQNQGNKEPTALIIGLVVSIAVIIAIIVIAVSTLVLRWRKRSDYDLLD